MLIIGDQVFSLVNIPENKAREAFDTIWQLLLDNVQVTLSRLIGNSSPQEQILYTALKRALENSKQHPLRYQSQLHRWLSPQTGSDKKPNYNNILNDITITPETRRGNARFQRHYRHWHEALLALNGWIQSQRERQFEKQLALANQENIYLDLLINTLIKKLHKRMFDTAKKNDNLHYAITMELLTGQTLIRTNYAQQELQSASEFGCYRQALNKQRAKATYLNKLPGNVINNNAPMAILTAPQNYRLADKIALLHDLAEYLGDQQNWNPETAGQWLINEMPLDKIKVSVGIINSEMQSVNFTAVHHNNSDEENPKTANTTSASPLTTRNNHKTARQSFRILRGAGLSYLTRDEEAASTLFAREFQLPLWSGHSTTVIRLLNMAQWANGQYHELTALAFGIATFWRLEYQPASPYAHHTLHEVLDMAKNFGVAYNIHPANADGKKRTFARIDDNFFLDYIDAIAKNIQHTIDQVLVLTEQSLPIRGDFSLSNKINSDGCHHYHKKIQQLQLHTHRLVNLIMKEVTLKPESGKSSTNNKSTTEDDRQTEGNKPPFEQAFSVAHQNNDLAFMQTSFDLQQSALRDLLFHSSLIQNPELQISSQQHQQMFHNQLNYSQNNHSQNSDSPAEQSLSQAHKIQQTKLSSEENPRLLELVNKLLSNEQEVKMCYQELSKKVQL